ncbi:MAG: glycosyltransferase [Flavobacteriales bacterium]|nr:glycosyltransferase [Flavobacteriales bacterium]
MHVLFLPKWYPGLKDPQLGDFLRKQALATAAFARMSVVHLEPGTSEVVPAAEVHEGDGAWELTMRYRTSTCSFLPWRKAINGIRYVRAGQQAWRRVIQERGRPDLIHAYILLRPVALAWWTGRRAGVPFMVSEQSSEFITAAYARRGRAYHAISRFLLRRARAITAVSAWLGEALKQHGLCDQYHIVPNVVPGIDRPLPPAGRPGAFLMVADLVDHIKNVSGVLRALASARSTDERLRLIIIGDGTDRAMLEQLTDRLGLRGAVTFLGRMPNTEVLDRMAEAFAVIVNSNVETFSVVTGEALAQGKPVIATRCGGPQAFITQANGILIEPTADAALADAMLQLTRDADRYAPADVRATVSDRFSPDAVGHGFHAIYQAVLGHA